MTRQWDLIKDMNHDGVFTISDVWGWFHAVFFYPGDTIMYWSLTDYSQRITRFFEVSPNSYGGFWSGIWSATTYIFLVWAIPTFWAWYGEWSGNAIGAFHEARNSETGFKGKEIQFIVGLGAILLAISLFIAATIFVIIIIF